MDEQMTPEGFAALNALLFPDLNNAGRMLEAGTASLEDIDTAMMGGCNFPMGPFKLLDLVGELVGDLGAGDDVGHAHGDHGDRRGLAEDVQEVVRRQEALVSQQDGEEGEDHDESDVDHVAAPVERPQPRGEAVLADLARGGGMHGGLHRREMANLIALAAPGARIFIVPMQPLVLTRGLPDVEP